MLSKNEIQQFIDSHNYDIRLSGYGRWVDQKCTPDVVSAISDCIVNFVTENGDIEFTVKDIWTADYSIKLIPLIFRKPSPLDGGSTREYDKFFGQPIKLLAYSRVLNETKRGQRNFYKINNLEILNYIALRERNAIDFMGIYFSKVLTDSGWIQNFNDFYSRPNKKTYGILRRAFFLNTKKYTKINKDLECGRIFTKVINLLAFEKRTYGSKGGNLSKQKISLHEIMYNRDNFRDIYNQKPKEMSREEYARINKLSPNPQYSAYISAKAKRLLREFNDKFRAGQSELKTDDYMITPATNIHHIFMESVYPEISHYLENLIALTPSQHYAKAHPNNNTSLIDEQYQHLCLLAKIDSIQTNLSSSNEDDIYNFEDMLYVLDVGLETDEFSKIVLYDYSHLIDMVNKHYTQN